MRELVDFLLIHKPKTQAQRQLEDLAAQVRAVLATIRRTIRRWRRSRTARHTGRWPACWSRRRRMESHKFRAGLWTRAEFKKTAPRFPAIRKPGRAVYLPVLRC